jgi:von Willebrand factor type A domain
MAYASLLLLSLSISCTAVNPDWRPPADRSGDLGVPVMTTNGGSSGASTGGATTSGSTTTGGTTGGGTTTSGTTGSGTTTGGTTSGSTTTGGTTSGGTTSTSGGTPVACPAVLFTVDLSASMSDNFSPTGDGGTLSHLTGVKMAVPTLVKQYPHQMAFGLETFSDTLDCSDGVNLLIEPAFGTGSMVDNTLNGLKTNQGTNTAQAIQTASARPALLDASRPARAIVLITDGPPNCAPTGATDPAYTISQIDAAAQQGIRTFVVLLGGGVEDVTPFNQMAQAGRATCSGSLCDGQLFYPAESQADLVTVLANIGGQLAGSDCNR